MTKSLTVLDLFSGLGTFALAGQVIGGFKTLQFVEKDDYCQKVLFKNFPGTPIHADISDYAPDRRFDIITGSFPCQDISSANPDGSGLDGRRSGLFFRVCDLIREIQPRYALLENVPALLTSRNGRDMGRALGELSGCGYDAEWFVVSASSMGAPHRRARVFIIAYPAGFGAAGDYENQAGTEQTFVSGDSWWRSHPHPEPSIFRMGNGLPSGMDKHRVKALGNAITPQQAVVPLLRIKQLEGMR